MQSTASKTESLQKFLRCKERCTALQLGNAYTSSSCEHACVAYACQAVQRAQAYHHVIWIRGKRENMVSVCPCIQGSECGLPARIRFKHMISLCFTASEYEYLYLTILGSDAAGKTLVRGYYPSVAHVGVVFYGYPTKLHSVFFLVC